MNRILWFAVLVSCAIAVSPASGVAEEFKPAPAGAKPHVDDAKAKHPQLAEVLAWMEGCLKRIDAIESYTTTIVSRERENDAIGEYRHVFLKYRREPKSFYMYFLAPEDIRGRQVLYVKNQRDDKLLVGGFGRGSGFGPVLIHPDSPLATRSFVCPLHKLNLRDLTQRAIDYLKVNTVQGISQVRIYLKARVNGRLCTVYEVDHRSNKGRFKMQIFADDELQLPCRFEVHTAQPQNNNLELLQEYTFVGKEKSQSPFLVDKPLLDRDFDARNPDYGFYGIKTHDDAIREKHRAELERKQAKPVEEKPQAEKKPEPTKSSSHCRCRRGRWRR
ncbi:MAG: DUF1571 domain-containing protein [Planctomycetes bacterium]|nr:DUF1571 domain-containing protein [Planctomycetota bacterium]